MADAFDLQRFRDAQDPMIDQVRRELRRGRKMTHWIWFIFPQVQGIGRSPTAQYYAIRSLEEAKAYLGDPVLGPRLRECTEIVNGLTGRTAYAIFRSPDDLKFHACMTLFGAASGGDELFATALEKFFAGEPHAATIERLLSSPDGAG
jgi:uncharacterized protein (DUF1810 family)